MARTRRTLDLDGRRIDYLELGDPAGQPVLYLHGTPSTGCEAGWLETAALRHGLRLVAPDRPGYLRSDLPADATLLGTAAHFLRVADRLELGHFGIAAFSGGTAFALAVAHVAPDQVTGVHVGGGLCTSVAAARPDELSRAQRALFRLAASSRLLAAAAMSANRRILRKQFAVSPAAAANELFKDAAKGRQVAAYESYIRDADADDLRVEMSSYIEATRSTAGVINDLRAFVKPWGFELRGVRAPVDLWHGTDDPAVSSASARRAATELPNGQLHLLEREGHFVFLAHADEIAEALAA